MYLMSDIGSTFRQWLQHTFKIAIPIRYNTKQSIYNAIRANPRIPKSSPHGTQTDATQTDKTDGTQTDGTQTDGLHRSHWICSMYKWDPLYILFGFTFLPNPNVSLRMEVTYTHIRT